MATKVFISWSGDLSNKLAEAIRQWLPGVLQFVKPYFTPSDIEKGTKWATDILGELDSSDVGIICLTKENLTKPWILFEAGALAKNFDRSRVCTILFDVESTDVKGPLTIFQSTKFERKDFKKLVKTINSAGGDSKLDDGVFDQVFDMWWDKLNEQVQKILADHKEDGAKDPRSERDILEEVLELSRLNARRKVREHEIHPEAFFDLVRCITELAAAARHGDMRMVNRMIERVESPIRHIARGARWFPELGDEMAMMQKRLSMLLESDPPPEKG